MWIGRGGGNVYNYFSFPFQIFFSLVTRRNDETVITIE